MVSEYEITAVIINIIIIKLSYMLNLLSLHRSQFTYYHTSSTVSQYLHNMGSLPYCTNMYCNSIVLLATSTLYLSLLVPPINTILLQYLLQYIAIQYIVPYLWVKLRRNEVHMQRRQFDTFHDPMSWLKALAPPNM